jgi:F-box protein 41
MEENLTEKTKELNLILARCQSLTEDDNPSHVITSHKLHEEIRQLKQTVSQLRQQITHLQNEQVSHHQETHLTDNDHINDNYTKSHQTTPMMDGDLNELLLVFSYLSIDDLFRVGRVCKRWREASLDPSLWQRVELSDRVIDSHGLVTIATRCSTTQHITIQGLYPLPAHPNEDLKSYIFHQKAGLERGLLMLLQTCGKNLKSLVISECNLLITERAFWIISKTCPHLSSLYYYSSEFPPTPESLWSLANGCTRLQSLSLPPTHDNELAHIFNDKCLYHITHGFPIVNKLMLGGMGMSLEGLTYLGNHS